MFLLWGVGALREPFRQLSRLQHPTWENLTLVLWMSEHLSYCHVQTYLKTKTKRF